MELMGDTAQRHSTREFVRHAANAVFHYFKHELGRQTVTAGEFAGALEKVLARIQAAPAARTASRLALRRGRSDLCRLAGESGGGCELFFFPRLREELRAQLQQAPRVLRFHGLRPCVMQLAGARRWTARCQNLEEQIVAYFAAVPHAPRPAAGVAALPRMVLTLMASQARHLPAAHEVRSGPGLAGLDDAGGRLDGRLGHLHRLGGHRPAGRARRAGCWRRGWSPGCSPSAPR